MAQIEGANDDFHRQISTKQVLSLKELPAYMLDWVENNCCETISIWDEDGYLIFVSKSIKQILGIDSERFIGTHWSTLLTPINDAEYNAILEKLNHEEHPSIELNLLDDQKNYVWCECKIDKLLDPEHMNIYYVSTISDITDKKETENMMVSYEKMSIAGQLAAGVAHEIRNPLTSLKGFLQLLQAGTAQKEAYYKIMIDEIKKMEQITSELLFISKPLTDYKQKENLSTMIKDIISLLHPQAKMKQIDIVHDLQEGIHLFCDRSQIKQVLINIVKNAIEAMDTPGTISINAFTKETSVVVSVKDEGPGIDETIIHKLGEPFFTTKQNGTGLGLMVTKQILEKHHANLRIYNNDKGSTFEMVFNNS